MILQRVQQAMVLIFALSGLYMFALPWWVKLHRKQQRGAAGQVQRSVER